MADSVAGGGPDAAARPPRPVRVVIAGGGTGGHVFPAIALARALAEAGKPAAVPGGSADVCVVGTTAGSEGPTIRAAGIDFEALDVIGFSRSASARNLLAAGKGALATLRAVRILRERGADVAVGLGAYVSVPVAAAAALLRIPFVVHEANAVPGVANRLAGRWATAVAVTFAASQRWFRLPVQVTGYPVRHEIAHLDRADVRTEALAHFGLEDGRRTLLVFGGSQGARRINEAALGCYDRWRSERSLQVLHLTGAKGLAAAEGRVTAARDPADALIWSIADSTDRMDLAYAAADLAVSRAGAATLSELACAGLPAVVVPYPYATADHQRANTQALVEGQAVRMILDADCTPEAVGDRVDALFADEPTRAAMSARIRSFARPDAAAALAELVRRVARPRTREGTSSGAEGGAA